MEHIVFLTGRLAEPSLRKVLAQLAVDASEAQRAGVREQLSARDVALVGPNGQVLATAGGGSGVFAPERPPPALLRQAFEEAPIGMAMTAVDRDGAPVIVRANRRYADALGFRVDQIVGRSIDGYTCGFPVSALDGRDALIAIIAGLLVLAFVGMKMLVSEIWPLGIGISLGVVGTLLLGSVLLSLVIAPKEPTEPVPSENDAGDGI